MNVHGCLSRLSMCGTVMDWQPVQDVTCLLSTGSRDELQIPELDKAGIVNGCMGGGWIQQFSPANNLHFLFCLTNSKLLYAIQKVTLIRDLNQLLKNSHT